MVFREWRGSATAFVLVACITCDVIADAASNDPGSWKARIENACVAKLNALVERGPDEALNAEPFYRKAFELYVEPPVQVDANAVVCWPMELTEMQRAGMSKWVESNCDALTQLQLAVQRPRYWFQYQEDFWRPRRSNNGAETYLPELLGYRAKLEAMNGKREDAVRDLAASYRIGLDLNKRLMLAEQVEGLAVSMYTLRAGLQIVQETQTDPAFLESLRRQLAERSKDRSFVINLTGPELSTSALIEKLYTAWPGNRGIPGTELAERATASLLSGQIKEHRHVFLTDEQVYAAFHGHTPEEMVNLVRRAYARANSIVGKTPFQLHEEKYRWDKSLWEAVDENPVLLTHMPDIPRNAEASFRFEAAQDALATVLALLRYKNDKDGFPADLKEVVSGGYLSRLPMDPYSDQPLVYRRTESSFILYSVGVDFQDDGGKPVGKWGWEPGGDYVFWPVQKLWIQGTQ